MTRYDTVIIGSGIAGLNFALNAAQYGKVLVVTKKRTTTTSTNRAQGGIAAVLDRADQFKKHVNDTIVAGAHHNVKKSVEFMVKNGPDAIRHLVEIGVPFATDENGNLLLTREGGHGKRRIAFVGDYTGQEIEAALEKQVELHPNIRIWEYTFAIDLMVKNNACYGIQAVHNDKLLNLYAANTVIATGGLGQLYQYTTNPIISTGDGIGMGLRVGLKTRDLEFIQFHPTALKVKGRTMFLMSEALRGEGAYLRNKKGKRFMIGVHGRKELAPRDIVAREVYKHDLSSGAFLDMRHLKGEEVKIRFPQIYQKLKTYNLDLTQDLIPICPAAHYACGGLITNLKGETEIKGLYAFGEVAWTGVHGANRLASNSLLEALVFSNQIIQQIKTRKLPPRLPKFTKPIYKKASDTEWRKLKKVREQIKQIMWEKVGIVRTREDLEATLQTFKEMIATLPRSKTFNVPEKENENMLLAAQEVTKAALDRRKSLGSHHRID